MKNPGAIRRGTAVAILTLAFGLSACPEEKGPMEKAGESIDDAAEEVGDALDPKGPAEKAGEAIDDATD